MDRPPDRDQRRGSCRGVEAPHRRPPTPRAHAWHRGRHAVVFPLGGVPDEIESSRKRLGIEPGTPLFSVVGELSVRKRPFDVVAALGRMKHRESHLVLLGDGRERRRVEADIDRSGPGRPGPPPGYRGGRAPVRRGVDGPGPGQQQGGLATLDHGGPLAGGARGDHERSREPGSRPAGPRAGRSRRRHHRAGRRHGQDRRRPGRGTGDGRPRQGKDGREVRHSGS